MLVLAKGYLEQEMDEKMEKTFFYAFDDHYCGAMNKQAKILNEVFNIY